MFEFANRMKNMENSAAVIKNIFQSMVSGDVISFGGGAIARECLPIDAICGISNEIMQVETRGVEALAYGPVLGLKDLRESIASELLSPKGVHTEPDTIMITSGGLEGLYLMCQLMISPGDVILVESPTFIHAVETFEMFEAKCIAVDMDEDGIQMDDLEAKIKTHHPKMIYVIPTFQNPSGRTLSRARREKVAELGSTYDVVVLEDDPYRDIRYSGVDLPPIKVFDKTGHTVLANSLSKIVSPGLRVGYIVAHERIMDKLIDAKSATNSHTSMLPQIICAEFFKRGLYPEHHKMLCDIHRVRRDTMIESIDRFFPSGTKRTYPDGGLFTWVELPESINTKELLVEATTNPEVNVAFVAGDSYFVEGNGKGSNCMRLSFGANPPDVIRIGIERLGKLICSKL